MFIWKSVLIAGLIIPGTEGAVYLLDTRDILFRYVSFSDMYEWFRPFLLSGIIAGVWSITGENYLFVRYFNLAFTLASAVVLYYLARREIGQPFAFAATLMYVTSLEVLYYTDFILVHGLTALFSILTLLAVKKYSGTRWLLGGVFAALAFLSRYTSIVIVIPIVLAYAVDLKRLRVQLIAALILGSGIPILVYHFAFPFVFPHFLGIYTIGVTNLQGSPLYYLLNWYNFFGIIAFSGLAVLLLPSTYKSLSSRPWAFWLIGSLAFFSLTSNSAFNGGRYTFEWTPAVAYLSMLGFKKIYDTGRSLRLSTIPSPSMLSSTQIRRLLVGTALTVLIFVQVFGSVGGYLQTYTWTISYYGKTNGLLTVAQYMRQHAGPNARFISDYDASDLAYFSGRCVLPQHTHISLDRLHKDMINYNVGYYITYPEQTGNTSIQPSILMQSGFLQLNGTLQTTLGQVFIFHRMGEIVENTNSLECSLNL